MIQNDRILQRKICLKFESGWGINVIRHMSDNAAAHPTYGTVLRVKDFQRFDSLIKIEPINNQLQKG